MGVVRTRSKENGMVNMIIYDNFYKTKRMNFIKTDTDTMRNLFQSNLKRKLWSEMLKYGY